MTHTGDSTKRSRALLVDTNRASYPTYQALLAMGHEVWVVGGRPDEPLARLCPNYRELDYSDRSALKQFIDEKGFDHVVPGCTDLSYTVCAEISQGRMPGIDRPETAAILNEKQQFRSMAESIGLPVPRVLEAGDALGTPAVIVKPVDSFSGRGMSILREPGEAQLEDALNQARAASSTGNCLIEEFVEGQLYSHSAFLSQGRIRADFIVREDCTTNPFTVDTSHVDGDFPEPMLESLRDKMELMADHLQLVDGLIHTQFIVREDRYWLIEITRRCPGDLYALLIEWSTGYPYAEAYAAAYLGKTAPEHADRRPPTKTHIIRHTASSRDGESLWGFRFNRPVDMRLMLPLATAGETIDPSPYGRAGLFFLAAKSIEERDDLYASLISGNLYTMS